MGMLEKIEYLMQIKNISNKKILADVSGLPYTTVAGLWVKPIDNTKRSTLFALAKALGCSVDYLGDDDIPLEAFDEDNPHPTYYLDPEVAELADQLHKNPELRILFDASKKLTKEDIQFVRDLVDRMKKDDGQ